MTRDTNLTDADEEIRVLRLLAEGCRKHPAYRARRRPGVAGCTTCDAMYDAARTLESLDAARTGYGA